MRRLSRTISFTLAAVVAAGTLTAASPPAMAATPGVPRTITLFSGNGNYIHPDPNTQLQLTPAGAWRQATIVREEVAWSYPTIPGTKWVSDNSWAQNVTLEYRPVLYRATFTLPDEFFTPAVAIQVHADDTTQMLLNGSNIGGQLHGGFSQNFRDPADEFGTSDASRFRPGLNTLDFQLTNFAGNGLLDYKAVVTFRERLACTLTYTGATATSGGAMSLLGVRLVGADGAGLGSKAVQFAAESSRVGVNGTFTTAADGTDSSPLALAAGVYALSGRFDGDDLHRPCSFSGVSLTVDREATSLAYAGDTLVQPGADATVVVELRGVADSINSRSGRSIDILFRSDAGDVTHRVVTDTAGLASAVVSLEPGVYAVSGVFAGDADYFGSALDATELVVRGATEIVAEPAVVTTSSMRPTLGFAATLTTGGVAMPGRVVSFVAGSILACSTVTGADGRAACTGPTALGAAVLNQGYEASFAGDVVYEAASASAGLVG